MALRGDPTVGTEHFIQPEGGYHNAGELISAVRKHSDFGIGAAGYPEGHVDNRTKMMTASIFMEKLLPVQNSS